MLPSVLPSTASTASTAQSAPTVAELTVGELAARTGMSVRTVRFYAGRDLLPPPQLRGRVAYYGPAHRARLELIRDLQQQGYTLAAIERYFKRIPRDATEADLALHRTLLSPWVPEPPEELDRQTLVSRAGRELSDDDIATMQAMGLLEHGGDGIFRTTPTALGLAISLLDLGVPFEALREAGAILQQHTRAVADELNEVFRRRIWEPFRRGESGATNEEMRSIVERMRPLVVQALVASYGRAADELVRQSIPEA
jgi:DNA-binding transcriptional MerR regulator